MKNLNLELCVINNKNKHWINIIKASPEQRPLLHYNAYWFGQSNVIDDISSFLIKNNSNYVGFVTFGSFYNHEYLQKKEKGTAEIIHLVIDEKFQQKGIGKSISKSIIQFFREESFTKVVVAVAEENLLALSFWKNLNFKESGLKNYDGDLLLEYCF